MLAVPPLVTERLTLPPCRISTAIRPASCNRWNSAEHAPTRAELSSVREELGGARAVPSVAEEATGP